MGREEYTPKSDYDRMLLESNFTRSQDPTVNAIWADAAQEAGIPGHAALRASSSDADAAFMAAHHRPVVATVTPHPLVTVTLHGQHPHAPLPDVDRTGRMTPAWQKAPMALSVTHRTEGEDVAPPIGRHASGYDYSRRPVYINTHVPLHTLDDLVTATADLPETDRRTLFNAARGHLMPVKLAKRKPPVDATEQAFRTALWKQWQVWRKHAADNERRGRPNVYENAPPIMDDTARLVFADWLQEHNDPREAIVRGHVDRKPYTMADGYSGLERHRNFGRHPDSMHKGLLYYNAIASHDDPPVQVNVGGHIPPGFAWDFSKDLIHPGITHENAADGKGGDRPLPSVVWRHDGVTTSRSAAQSHVRFREHPVMFHGVVSVPEYFAIADTMEPDKKKEWEAFAEHRGWKRPEPVKLARPLPQFTPHAGAPKGSTLLYVDPARLHESWKNDPGYIHPGSGDAHEQADFARRRAHWDRAVVAGGTLEAPSVYLSDKGHAAFQDGRHRFTAMKDGGLRSVAVTVPGHQAAEFTKRFGFQKPVKLSRPVFEKAMEDNPHDRDAKLIYADWLEENGHEQAAHRLRWYARLKQHMESPNAPHDRVYHEQDKIPHWAQRLILIHRIQARAAKADFGLHAPAFHSALASAERDALGLENQEGWEKANNAVENFTIRGPNERAHYDAAMLGDEPSKLMFGLIHAVRARTPDSNKEPTGRSGAVQWGHAWLDTNDYGSPDRNVEADARDFVGREAREGRSVPLARVQGGMGDAVGKVRSDNTDKRVELAKQVLSEAGITPATVRAVLAHTDDRGVRPAVMAACVAKVHPKLARFAAAWIGLLTGERRVTIFHPGEGEDVLHVIDSPHPPAHVGDYLKRAGVPSFTLESRGSGTRAFVSNPMDMIPVENVATGLQAEHHAIPGRAVRIGAGDDKDARASFRQVIDDTEREAGL